MALSVGGLGSGMDIDGLIKNLMAVEARPLYMLQQKEALLQQKVSAVGQVKGAVSTFQSAVKALQDAGKFVSYKGTSSSSDHVDISASSKAPSGSFSVLVQQLAQEQKLASGNFTSAKSAITGATESKLTFSFGSTAADGSFSADGNKTPKSVTIPANATLEDIRDAVNKADVGVNASIVNDGSGYKLVYSSKSTGTQSTMKVEASDAALNQVATHDQGGKPLLGSDGKAMLATVQVAKDAKFLLDGIQVTKQSNTVSDAIDGVTLTLKKAQEEGKDSAVRLSVSKDTSGIKSSLEGLVKGYNELMKALKDVSSVNLDAKPKPGEARPAGILNGASIIRTIQTQIRSAFNEGADNGGVYTMASQFGVTFNQDGTMKLDEKMLDKALKNNADDIAKFFATDAITSDSGISYVGGSSKTQAGEYEIVITQLLNGTKEAGDKPSLTVDASNKDFTLKVDGKEVKVSLAEKTYASAAELAHAIESGVNEKLGKDGKVSVTVDPDSGKLAIQSGKTGKESSVELVSGLGFAGFTTGVGIPGGDSVAGTIGGHPAKGDGNKLVGAVGSPVEGLTIAVNGGVTGKRGTVSFTKGFAFDLDQKLEGLVKKDGAIDAFSTGLSESAKGLTKQQEAMEMRLVATEKRYKQQFSAMDALLAQYNNMSNFLTQQINAMNPR